MLRIHGELEIPGAFEYFFHAPTQLLGSLCVSITAYVMLVLKRS